MSCFVRAVHYFLGRLRLMSQRGNDQRRQIYPSYCSKAAFSLSLRISTGVQEEGVFSGSWKRNGLLCLLGWGFFWCPSLLVLHRIDVLLMASKARDAVPVNIRHMKRLKLRNSDGLWRHGGSSVLGLPYSPVDICKCCKRKKQHGENVGCDWCAVIPRAAEQRESVTSVSRGTVY